MERAILPSATYVRTPNKTWSESFIFTPIPTLLLEKRSPLQGSPNPLFPRGFLRSAAPERAVLAPAERREITHRQARGNVLFGALKIEQ